MKKKSDQDEEEKVTEKVKEEVKREENMTDRSEKEPQSINPSTNRPENFKRDEGKEIGQIIYSTRKCWWFQRQQNHSKAKSDTLKFVFHNFEFPPSMSWFFLTFFFVVIFYKHKIILKSDLTVENCRKVIIVSILINMKMYSQKMRRRMTMEWQGCFS